MSKKTLILLTLINFFYKDYLRANSDKDIQVFFSPKGGCINAIVSAIELAKKSVYVQAFIFTSEPIFQALAKAHNNGIEVKIIADYSQREAISSKIKDFAIEGIPVMLHRSKGLHHSKVLIIDNDIVITGSYNFTKAAENRNVENIVIIKNKKICLLFKKEFNRLLSMQK